MLKMFQYPQTKICRKGQNVSISPQLYTTPTVAFSRQVKIRENY